jgi:hypothetical protein
VVACMYLLWSIASASTTIISLSLADIY